jgi:type II secretory pathway pseudopilin PulG
METITIFVPIFVGILISVLIAIGLPLYMRSQQYRASQEKARARRMADAKLNARLLRITP